MNITKEKIFEMGYHLFIGVMENEGLLLGEETKRILVEDYGFSKEEALAFQKAVCGRHFCLKDNKA